MVRNDTKTRKKYHTKKISSEIDPDNILKYWENLNKNAEQMARWMSLYEAVNLVADKAQDRGISFDKIDLPPLKLKEYMDSTVDIYYRQYLQAEFGIDVFYTDSDLFKNSMKN